MYKLYADVSKQVGRSRSKYIDKNRLGRTYVYHYYTAVTYERRRSFTFVKNARDVYTAIMIVDETYRYNLHLLSWTYLLHVVCNYFIRSEMSL